MTTGHNSIIVCDDDASIRSLVKAILSADGYEIRQATDADGAIEALDESPPGLLILDMNVSGEGSGLTVLHHVRSASTLSETAVLMVTGITAAGSDGWGKEIGADGHLLKPFQIDELRSVVRSLMPAA